MPDQIVTERLLLRPWRGSDRAPFARINSDPRVMEFLGPPLSTDDSNAMVARIEQHFAERGFGAYAAEFDGVFIGFIGLNVPSWMPGRVEIAWRLAAESWGRGLATEGARAVVKQGFDTLGLDEIVSFTVPTNVRSRRVMEKLGMTYDPADDFDHPRVPEGSPLRRHVLYRLRRRSIGGPPVLNNSVFSKQ